MVIAQLPEQDTGVLLFRLLLAMASEVEAEEVGDEVEEGAEEEDCGAAGFMAFSLFGRLLLILPIMSVLTRGLW